ncbi:MAG: flagellar hook-associated protein 3 [Candidatus Nitrohelix vancouverensis]|uniref:Flagellar hook-associated protein 3 n=1 Tax=Candidatus Nitrohelix vancouverensis TaxID=2705534 RepID=A0A7T0C0S9_9BACT|nr:MAG: flagellar hook-associated protein 3 [Candidatus Nitrohelix vancouverensis]
MVTRVTAKAVQDSTLRNVFRITENLFNAQKQISTGKRILKPSDDPSGMRDSLALRSSIKQRQQFVRNIENNRIFIQSADTALSTVGSALNRSKELAIQGLAGTATSATRDFAAGEVDKLLQEALQAGNTKAKNQYVFSGTQTRTSPFELSASGAVYKGNTENFTIAVASNTSLEFALPGSDVLAVDLNPSVTTATALSSMNGGTGVSAGTFTLTDRGGNSATILVSAGQTLGNVISSINSAGLNITASINSSNNGIQLVDSSSVITGELVVAEVGTGTTASELGIFGSRDGNLVGTDINPVITSTTQISQLKNGAGLTLGDISIVNGAASGTVSLASAATIGDVLNTINAAGFNVTASINSAGNGLRIASNSSTTVAVVNDIGTGTTAESLGLGGGLNVLNTLFDLKNALERDDNSGILASLANLDSALAAVNESRAIIGSVQGRIDSTANVHAQEIVFQKEQISNIEDADLTEQASELANLEFALQATLSSTARIIQPTLLDFLR